MSAPATGTAGPDSRRLSIGRADRVERAVRLYCLAAGACDLTTGLLLVATPFTVLGLMGVAGTAGAGEEGVYLRYIGTFVAAVGAAYLYPLVLPPRGGGRDGADRLPTVLEVTALVRGAVAVFVTAAVTIGTLAAPWLLVAAVDGGLAALQLRLLRLLQSTAAGGAR